MSTLKQQAYKGVFWTLLEKIGNQGLQFIIGIVLARILTPEEFGLVGIITVFIVISAVFVDSGFGLALINKKEISREEESSVFWLNVIISIVVFAILYVVAPSIATFYNEPVLSDLTRVLGLILIIQAFSTIHLNLLSREMDFKTQFKMTITSKIVAGIAGIWAALTGYGVWALVIQRLVQTFWQTVGLWMLYNWRPRLYFSFSTLKPLWKYGSNVLLSSLFTTISDNIYSLVIGKQYSAKDLGYYRRAKDFQWLPVSFLTATIGKVSLPLYSKVKNEKETYIQLMRKSLVLMSFVSFPIMAALAVMAEPLIVLLVKEKWLPSVPYVQILCISGMLYPWHLMNVQALLGYGRSDLNLKITFLKNGLRILNLIIMMNFSVLHIVIGEVIIGILGLFINTYYTKKIFNYGLLKQLYNLRKIFFITLLVTMITILPLYINASYLETLLLQILVFTSSFILLNKIFNAEVMNNVIRDIKTFL